jgi:hypothetical protein
VRAARAHAGKGSSGKHKKAKKDKKDKKDEKKDKQYTKDQTGGEGKRGCAKRPIVVGGTIERPPKALRPDGSRGPQGDMFTQEVDNIVAKQGAILETKNAAMQQVTVGRPVQYVGPRGDAWQPAGRHAGMSIPAPTLRRGQDPVRLRLSSSCARGSDVLDVVNSDSTFVLVDSGGAADVIVVGDIASGWFSVSGLKARLFGKRFADVTWVKTRMAAGRCVAFMSVVENAHWELFLSDAFVNRNSDYAAVLRKAARKSGMTQGGVKRFVVANGQRPTKPKFPRLSFQVLDGTESAAPDVPSLTLEQLIDKLSIVYGPERRSSL